MSLNEKQRQARRAGIGGSDIAAVLGLSRWRTPYDVWREKMGLAEDESGRNEPNYWGQMLEDVTAREYQKRAGRRVQRVNQTLKHPKYDWAIAHIDRAVVIPGRRAVWRGDHLAGAEKILECKTASAWKSREWNEGEKVPLEYQAQCQWYLAITGLGRADIAALIGGQKFIIRKIKRDDETIRAMLARAEEFWRKYVVERIPPPPINTADILQMFPVDDGDFVEIGQDAETLETFNQLRQLRDEKKTLDEKIDALTESLKVRIGEHSGLTIDGHPVVTWKTTKTRKYIDWESIACELGAHQEIVKKFTTYISGSRRFLIK
ncbi:MAG: hypothetical protein AXA67_02210 [Methylothermaceae bacteria B42]|nr:MAG: hypothetical protein AXA67_02210 [Methylothermaceae bacteria B42]HHJ39301.1 hypothetical protein [Methylothermaceae bacterium]